MTYMLKSWTKPGTTDVRIYINGGLLAAGDKLYIFAGDDGWDAKLYVADGNLGYSHLGMGRGYDAAMNIAERALAERSLERASFADILAAVEG